MKKLFLSLSILIAIDSFSAVSISPSTLNNGLVQHPFRQTIVAYGGTSPYTWLVTGGSLPTGLTLLSTTNTSAVISGTPTTSGIYSFSVSATDRNGVVGVILYSDTINYNFLSISQMKSVWERSVPDAPYNFDTWNSLETIGGLLTIKKSFTNAAIIASYTTAVTVIPTPPTGYFINVVSCFVDFTYGSSAFATNTTGALYAEGTSTTPFTTNFIASVPFNSTASSFYQAILTPSISTSGSNVAKGKALMFSTKTGAPTAGVGSSFNLYVTYNLIPY